MSQYANPSFWVEACDKAIQVAAKAAIGVIGTNLISVTNIDWVGTLNIAAAAALVSILVSIANPEKGKYDDRSTAL